MESEKIEEDSKKRKAEAITEASPAETETSAPEKMAAVLSTETKEVVPSEGLEVTKSSPTAGKEESTQEPKSEEALKDVPKESSLEGDTPPETLEVDQAKASDIEADKGIEMDKDPGTLNREECKEQGVAQQPPKEEKSEPPRNPYEDLRYAIVRNDGKSESMIKLVGLKSLFSKQLPKMPRAYIARLVFDRRHTSLAILSEDPKVKDTDEEIIGGICYRAFKEMRFAEIAFCAVNASHQVKVRQNEKEIFGAPGLL